ncbi:hypothetical protein GH714_041667 [Hevea brasiliensis]|uniref:Uncharacterized protein n=1 Tax=Hevea brasiliensis TaxID=3981 RepID=A0A6A6MVJ9_HEVBR|nr:hypothetical protein GH714_041667 [Hevea brasiliensis]
MEEEFQQNTSAEDVQQQNEQNHGVDELEALENGNGNMNSASGEENQGNEVEGCYQAPIASNVGIRNFDLKIEDGLFDSSSQVAKNWISL